MTVYKNREVKNDYGTEEWSVGRDGRGSVVRK